MPKYSKLKFKVDTFDDGEQHGHFDWGSSRVELFESFSEIDDYNNLEEAVLEYIAIIEEDPEFIEAYNSLGWLELEILNFGNALQCFDDGYQVGRKLIPKNFNGSIDWGFLENRPFLRAMQGIGMVYLEIGQRQKATNQFNHLLKYNPNDNQGVRALAIESLIAQGKFKEILKINATYPNDILPEVMYGAVMANYYLGKEKEAKKALKDAIKLHPHVAKELTKTKHKKIESEIHGHVSIGGEDQAYEYWDRTRQYWTNPQLLAFIKDGLVD